MTRESSLRTLPQFSLIVLPLGGLTIVKFDFNPLETVDFDDASKVTLWESSNNRLEKLPEALLRAPLLVTLNCTNNKLTELPEVDLPKLEILNVNGNALTALPKLNTPSLRTLFLADNPITSLDPDFPQTLLRFNCKGSSIPTDDPTLEAIKKHIAAQDNGRFII